MNSLTGAFDFYLFLFFSGFDVLSLDFQNVVRKRERLASVRLLFFFRFHTQLFQLVLQNIDQLTKRDAHKILAGHFSQVYPVFAFRGPFADVNRFVAGFGSLSFIGNSDSYPESGNLLDSSFFLA